MSNVRTDPGEGGGPSLVRIGELARRSGTPAATLRAWERRYGVVSPRRGESGYRLYSDADERRVRGMVELIAAGLAPAEAAQRVRAGAADAPPASAPAEGPVVEALRAELLESLWRFDEVAANRAFDRAAGALSVRSLLGEVVLPALREIGERWSNGSTSIGQEHFASSLLRGRLLGLARGWGGGEGRLALLACPGGELHDLGLIAFGLGLREVGWRIAFLGADTPVRSIDECAAEIEPEAVVVFAMDGEPLATIEPDLRTIAERTALLLAGAGTDAGLCRRVGAVALGGDPLAAALSLAL